MADDSNIIFLERVERHREQLLRRRRAPGRSGWQRYEAGSFEPRLARAAQRRPLDEFIIEEMKEGAQT